MFPNPDDYRAALPFRHAVVDNAFIGPGFLDGVEREFPAASDSRWLTFDSEHEQRKQQLANEHTAVTFPQTGKVLSVMMGQGFVARLEHLTGIDGLIPRIEGGGMHQTLDGGYLNMHVDSATDFGARTMYRRLNVLLYLNHDWRPQFGGALRLRDDAGDWIEIAPRYNRLVVFDTGPSTWHGHPDAWAGLLPRRSLAVYYYTATMPEGFDPERETTFVE